MSSLKCSSNFTFLFFRVPSFCTDWCVLPVIKSGALKENALMTDRRWLTEVGVSGQAMQNVHIPVVVVHITEQEIALIPRKYICILFQQQFVITAFTWNIFIWGLITLQPKIDDGPSSVFLFVMNNQSQFIMSPFNKTERHKAQPCLYRFCTIGFRLG